MTFDIFVATAIDQTGIADRQEALIRARALSCEAPTTTAVTVYRSGSYRNPVSAELRVVAVYLNGERRQ
jgi:hypothetical protein